MEQTDDLDLSKGLDVAQDFALDVVPMLGLGVLTFRTFRLDPLSTEPMPMKRQEPIGMTAATLRQLGTSLLGLAAQMESMQIGPNGPGSTGRLPQ